MNRTPSLEGLSGHMTPSIRMQAGLLLRAPWQWLRNDKTYWALRLYLALMITLLGGPAVAALLWLPPRQQTIALALLGSLALLCLWGLHFAALLRLDHPHTARLVPGHSQALRATALGLWLMLTALCGLAAGVVNALSATQWGITWQMALVVMTCAGAALLYVAAALRWWWLSSLLWLWPVSAALPPIRAAQRNLPEAALQHWQSQPWLATALALLAMGIALTTLFGHGNAAHLRAYASRERMRQIIAAGTVGQKPTLAAYGLWGEWLGAPWQRLADAWLFRVIAHADVQRGSVMARAEVVLHGAQHWVRQLGILVPVLLVGLAIFWMIALLSGVDTDRIFEHGHVGMSIGLVSMTLGPMMSLPGALWVTRREQALLMLLPGMPRGATLNRALGWRQFRHYLSLWVLTLPAFAGLAWAGNAPQLLAFPACSLPVAAWLWRDVARIGPASTATSLWPYLAGLTLGMASMLLLRSQSGAWLPWLATMAVLSAVLLTWRWHRLSGLPQALPAGRLA